MYYYPYSLKASGPLNARSADFCRTGFLIRTDEGGYGCVHPWPELGDATFYEELAALRQGEPLTLGKRALECAAIDAEARRKGIRLLDGLEIPESHATLPPSVSPATVRLMDLHGFSTGKIQAMPNIDATRERLGVLAAIAPTWRWRLDFNASLEANDILRFWESLSEDLRALIDFIEDPCPYTYESWKRLVDSGIPLACDLGSDDEHQPLIPYELRHMRIIKPAREETPDRQTSHYVFTSVMDHPVGQLWAVYNAAVYYREHSPARIPLCGLCTHHLFERDAFTEQLGPLAPVISIPEGTGLGFDSLLEKLEWQPLG